MGCVVGIYLLTCISLQLLPLVPLLQPLLTLVLLLHLLRWYFQYRTQCSGLLIYENGQWIWELAGNRSLLRMQGEQVVWSWMLILNFRSDNERKKLTFILPRGALANDDMRRLRVLLDYLL